MTECEICGKEAVKRAEIDGATVNVCEECARYGKVLPEPVKRKPKSEPKMPDSSKYVDPDYPELVKKAREKKGLKIGELAKRINEKESVVSRLETGHLSPPLKLARKLESFLDIKLILEYEDRQISRSDKEGSGLTIGDVVEIDGADE